MEQRNKDGFLQHYQNPLIDWIQFKFDGTCSIYFKDGSTADHFVDCEAAYHEQFGIPVSPDGKLLFVSSWEKGLTAFHTITGEKVWHFRSTKIGTVFAYPNFLIARRYGKALLKLDLRSGIVLQELKSGTLERIYRLDDNYLFVDRLRGKYCVLDAAAMEILKTYSPKTVNPSNCLSLCIREARLQDGQLHIRGFEEYPNRNRAVSQYTAFYRTIDPDFYQNSNA